MFKYNFVIYDLHTLYFNWKCSGRSFLLTLLFFLLSFENEGLFNNVETYHSCCGLRMFTYVYQCRHIYIFIYVYIDRYYRIN